jgi:DNA-directed RNA polymerase specialized sigma24 family protein
MVLSSCRYEADDLVQQTLIIMYERWSGIDPAGAPTAYAKRVLYHVFAAERRSARARIEVVVGEPGEPSGPQRADGDLYDRVEATLALSVLLGRLPPGQRAG